MPDPDVQALEYRAELYEAGAGSKELPVQFSYPPPIPPKRVHIQPTVGGVVRQIASAILDVDTLMSWECPKSSPIEFKYLFNLWNRDDDPDLRFNGYWGERFVVRFHSFDPPPVRAALFDLSGSFHIQTVEKWYDIDDIYNGNPCGW